MLFKPKILYLQIPRFDTVDRDIFAGKLFLWNSKAVKILKLKHIIKFIANAWASSNAWGISISPCMVKMSHKCMVNSKY